MKVRTIFTEITILTFLLTHNHIPVLAAISPNNQQSLLSFYNPTMSTSPTEKTATTMNDPVTCTATVDKYQGSNSSPVASKNDACVAPEKDNDDTSLTVKKLPSGASLVFLGKNQIKKRSETRKLLSLILFIINKSNFFLF